MSEEHIPVDSKGDNADYRSQVWGAVSQRIQSALTPLSQDTTFNGTWDVEFDMFGSRQPMFQYDFIDQQTIAIITLIGNDHTPQIEQYCVNGDGRMTISDETYHAATTEDGKLVLFNGDQSLVMIATKR